MEFETKYIKYEDSAMGKMEQFHKEQVRQQIAELHKLRDDFDNYRTNEAAYKAAQELRAKKGGKKGVLAKCPF